MRGGPAVLDPSGQLGQGARARRHDRPARPAWQVRRSLPIALSLPPSPAFPALGACEPPDLTHLSHRPLSLVTTVKTAKCVPSLPACPCPSTRLSTDRPPAPLSQDNSGRTGAVHFAANTTNLARTLGVLRNLTEEFTQAVYGGAVEGPSGSSSRAPSLLVPADPHPFLSARRQSSRSPTSPASTRTRPATSPCRTSRACTPLPRRSSAQRQKRA